MSGNDTTILRSSASPKRVSDKEKSANAHVQVSNSLPVVNVTMGNGKPQQKNSMQKGNVVVWGGAGGNKRPPSNVKIFDPKGAGGSSVMVMPRVQPTLSSGALLLCQNLVTEYIAEQSQEGGDLTAADLARTILGEIEIAINPVMAKAPSPAMIAHQVGQGGGRPGAAPRGVPRAGTGTLPMVSVDLRNAAPVVEVQGPSTSPNGKPMIEIDMDDASGR